ncbi:MAG: metallophosphoesterase [SAR324 cluster bacterium]|nr:metallophosphoesterase [SAR324 cluster bacterium]
MPFTIIHISDLHFHAFPRSLPKYASKQALGSLNLLLSRRQQYPDQRFNKLVSELQNTNWDHLVISGDITSLSLEQEFRKARQLLQPLLKYPDKVTVIPGNHDRYIRAACQPDLFNKYFARYFVKTGIKTQRLTEDWHLIGWDSTHPNDWITAGGTVSRATLLSTEAYIRAQAPHIRFLLVNHYPLWFPPGQQVKPHHELYNLAHVLHWIKHQPRIAVYLHGHIHRNWSHQMSRETEPLHLINSASTTETLRPGQLSSYHRIQLHGSQIEVEPLLL